MNVGRRISIRQLIGLLLVAAVVVAGLLFRVTTLQLDNASDRREAQLDRADDLGLGTEVSTSAADLTRMAQLYVATGDERYRRYHERILDIRAGEAPRPVGYDADFWQEVIADGMGDVEVGDPTGLVDLARTEELTAPELQQLRDAIGNSNQLAEVEQDLMQSIRRELSGKGAPENTAEERRLSSAEYHDRRQRISDSVDAFNADVADRTEARVAELEDRRDELLVARAVILAVLGLVVAAALFVTARWIVSPLRRLTAVTRRISTGEYGQRTKPGGVAELTQLSVDFNEMADAIQGDIARREAAEHAAEEADRAKSEFLAVMSHELRTPMVGVSGTLDVLARTNLETEQRELVQIAQRSAASMLEIIGEVLDMSKIEAGKLTIAPATVSLRNVLEDAVTQYRQAASEAGLVLSLDVDPGLAAAHVIDSERLRQVIANLLSNSVKFTPQGRVEVRAKVLAEDEGEQKVEISVEDTGIGISSEDQRKLFEPFQQVDGGATRRAGGTGLGLVISREITQKMGGELTLESDPGKGTTTRVTLTLPIGDPAKIAPEIHPAIEGAALDGPLPGSALEAQRAGRLLLLVEDHPVNRRVICTQLEAIGFLAETAEDGIQGLERMGERDYALVLADIHMPNMDGYELARRARFREAETGGPRVPMIAVTASALHGELERCRQAGMDDLITKPTTIAILSDRLRRMLPDLPWVEGAAPEGAPAPPPKADAAPAPEAQDPEPEQRDPEPGDGEVLDPSVLVEMTGGDAALGESLLGQFVESARADAIAVKEAFDSGIARPCASRRTGWSAPAAWSERSRCSAASSSSRSAHRLKTPTKPSSAASSRRSWSRLTASPRTPRAADPPI